MSELAQKRIAENKRTKAKFLDLGNCGLKKVPAEVGELVWLESLSLADDWYEWNGHTYHRKWSRDRGGDRDAPNRVDFGSNIDVTDLAPVASLSALKSLYLSHTRVGSLEPLAGLSSLEELDISGTQVSDLGPLAGLSALRSLFASRTEGITDLRPLSELRAVEGLVVQGTAVTDVAPLAKQSGLRLLDLGGLHVTDLKPLAGLSAL